jgi:hypothetical protein
VAIHQQRGTYRADRHGPIGGVTDQREWTPTAADLARLGEAGRALVARVLADYALLPIDGLRLLEAGAVVDKIAALLALDRAGLTVGEVAALDRGELAWRQLFARHLDTLGIER